MDLNQGIVLSYDGGGSLIKYFRNLQIQRKSISI